MQPNTWGTQYVGIEKSESGLNFVNMRVNIPNLISRELLSLEKLVKMSTNRAPHPKNFEPQNPKISNPKTQKFRTPNPNNEP